VSINYVDPSQRANHYTTPPPKLISDEITHLFQHLDCLVLAPVKAVDVVVKILELKQHQALHGQLTLSIHKQAVGPTASCF